MRGIDRRLRDSEVAMMELFYQQIINEIRKEAKDSAVLIINDLKKVIAQVDSGVITSVTAFDESVLQAIANTSPACAKRIKSLSS